MASFMPIFLFLSTEQYSQRSKLYDVQAATLNCSSSAMLPEHPIKLTGASIKNSTNKKRTHNKGLPLLPQVMVSSSNYSRPLLRSIIVQQYLQGSLFRRIESTPNCGHEDTQHNAGVSCEEAHFLPGQLHSCSPRTQLFTHLLLNQRYSPVPISEPSLRRRPRSAPSSQPHSTSNSRPHNGSHVWSSDF